MSELKLKNSGSDVTSEYYYAEREYKFNVTMLAESLIQLAGSSPLLVCYDSSGKAVAYHLSGTNGKLLDVCDFTLTDE